MCDVLLFLPETGFYQYVRTLCALGEAIAQNNRITLLHCTGQMRFCNMMQATSVCSSESEKRKELCERCNSLFNMARKHYKVKSIELSELVDEKEIRILEKKVPTKISDLCNFCYKDIPIGKISQAALSLKVKFLFIDNLSQGDIDLFRLIALDAMIVVNLLEKIFKNTTFSNCLAFNPYTSCVVAELMAKQHGVNFSYVTGSSYKNNGWSHFFLTNRVIGIDFYAMAKQYSEISHFPVLRRYVRFSWENSFFHFYGSDGHIFSNAKSARPEDILRRLGFSKQKKTIVAFTSSNDEMICDKVLHEVSGEVYPVKKVFSSQIEWIDFLKEYAECHKNIQVIVRVHPREGKRQNGILSEHLLLLQKHFFEFTGNFVIIWSDDPISSYDLVELADICLIGWSTMGQECARIGIPVLTYVSRSYYVPSKSFYIAESKEDYKDKLNCILQREYTISMLLDGIRYDCWRTFSMEVDCSDTISQDLSNENYWPVVSKKKSKIIRNICAGNIDIVEYNKDAWLSKLNDSSEAEELKETLYGISTFYNRVFCQRNYKIKRNILWCIKWFICIISLHRIEINIKFDEADACKVLMHPRGKISPIRFFLQRAPLFWLEDNCNVFYLYKGRIHERYSPLLWKLGKIYQEQFLSLEKDVYS